jgi:uncharacterized membrane protein
MPHDQSPNGAKKGTAAEPRHTGQQSNKQTEPVTRNVQAIVDLEKKALEDRKHYSRISELFTNMVGSPAFIAGHVLIVAAWIIFNSTRLQFDPVPFNLLNLVLAVEALILTSIVLIAQRDLRRLADLRAHLDLQVNILAEQELTAILGLLNHVCRRLGIDPKKTDPDVEQLSQETDLGTVAQEIQKGLDENARVT